MVPRAAIIIGFLLLLAAVATPSSGPHIADLNILLPPRLTNPVPYRLQGRDGCFSWSWDHHDILLVQPEYNDSRQCSTSARLISIAPYGERKETAVYATDLRTGVMVRCKVLIDKISRIKIFHHAVKINLDELATLHITAFDDEDNVFSSLAGLRFLWQLIPKSLEADRMHRLFHVPLKETPLSDCGSGFCGDLDARIELEEDGLGSDLYVVKGVGIGHEIVKAKLLEPQLEHVEDEITLTVAEAMSLDPLSPVFVTVGTLIYYSLRVIRGNAPQVIELPSPHHQWSVLNCSVARVDSLMGTVHTLRLGMTNVIVEDIRVSGHIQASALHVVLPEKLLLYLVPITSLFDPVEGIDPIPSSDTWYVFPGQLYIIYMKVFSEGPDSNEIFITEQNTDLKLEDNTFLFWDILLVSNADTAKYGWRYSRLLKPYSVGEGTLTASLFYRNENEEEAQVLKVVQEVNVCRKVKFSIREQVESLDSIRIPWAPGIYQEVQLMATGGCGKLFWSSADEAIVSVSASGFVRAKRPGTTTIKVFSLFDSINYDEVVLVVTLPSVIVILPIYPVEGAGGCELKAAVTLKTSDGNYFYQCDSFNSFIKWSVFSDSETFRVLSTTEKICEANMLHLTENSKQSYSQPCAWTCLFAHGTGRAVLHATLSTDLHSPFHSTDEPFILKTAFPIAAFSPLIAYQAGNGNRFGGYSIDMSEITNGIKHSYSTALDELYLAPGSAMDIHLCGGPERWHLNVEYVEKVEVTGEHDLSVTNGVQVHRAFFNGSQVYTALCLSVGKFKLMFSRGNLVGVSHPIATIAKLELSVICSFPSSIILVANEPENTLDVIETAANADRGTGHVRSTPIIVAYGCTIRIAAVGLHITKKVFANSSSLCLSWELVGCNDLAYWRDIESCKRSIDNNWERFLVLNKTSGLCTVRASVIGFSEALVSHPFGKEYLQLDSAKGILTDAVQLQLVSSLRVMPEFLLIVFDPVAKVNLSISGGTCFLDAITNDTNVAHIVRPSENTKCSHLIVSPHGLGTALVTIRDIGLSPPVVAFSLVKVANVEWIKIASEEDIILMEGTIRTFELLAGTNDGYIFESSQFEFMNIHVHIEDGIVEVIGKNNSSSIAMVGPSFSVRAATVGITTIYVRVRQWSGHERLSQNVKVEVYKPLLLHPNYIYLTPGSSYMLKAEGGPITRGFIKYASMHEETAVVHTTSGKLSAISIGNASVRAEVYGQTGNLICEVYGRVEVGIPSIMILSSQSDQLCIGCKMPIFPSFLQGGLFSFYEVCNNYEWKVDSEKTVQHEGARALTSDVEKLHIQCSDGWTTFCNSSDSDVGFIMTLFGRSPGRAEVVISFSCNFLLSGSTQTVHYSASKTLTVVPDPPMALGMQATWVLPPSYTSSDLLPLADSYGLDVHSHREGVVYSVLRTCESKLDSITIHGGKIKTRESNNLACIQAKDQSTQRTEIASCIRVAQVAQVRVSAADYSFHLAYLGVNARLELKINYCDELGFTFAEANGVVPLDVEINYPDILSIEMPDTRDITSAEKIFLLGKSPGRALVQISIRHNPKKADFILVSVGAQLYPQNPVLNMGNSINFSVMADDGLLPGQWFCSNESVLSLNKITGEARASAEGRTQVFFQGSNFKLQTVASVIKLNQIIVETPSDTLTNAPFPSKGYKFAVKLSDLSAYKYKYSGDNFEVPFECRVDPPIIGYAKPWIDDVLGEPYCLFFPYTPKHLEINFSKSKAVQSREISNSEGSLYVSIIASLKEAPYVSGFAHALFVGGFSIGIEQLNLTRSCNQSRITITGNTDLELYWNAKDLLLVTLISKEGSGIGGFVEFEVKVLKRQSFRDKIIFVLPATGQKAEVDVIYENGASATSARASSLTWAAVIVCLIVLLSTIFVFVKLLDRPSRSVTSMPTVHSSSAIASPSTPEAASVPAGSQFSPRTPQPFVEYVRRTIDETPYYKRDGRRRFDPQHTY
ncbi:LOW QUALITY PROTEIN: nuclear pore complex protein GP210 [Phalaenopsis equestris]|uniref:LOW QUALITY PROTEIN: nuclear pore complex protein GP210 n=1 Tax=Phalaenopsis equestris TaxID=78828 RepID=UPI0009E4D5CE|nr:LOW QUALITY PROTEIN: nuclear pore complex protein GP210 [Phalaenopsis equestris]